MKHFWFKAFSLIMFCLVAGFFAGRETHTCTDNSPVLLMEGNEIEGDVVVSDSGVTWMITGGDALLRVGSQFYTDSDSMDSTQHSPPSLDMRDKEVKEVVESIDRLNGRPLR